MQREAPIWYPEIKDVEAVYDRIAGIYEAPEPPDEEDLTALIVAPQRAGREERQAEPLAQKSVALLETGLANEVFPKKNRVTLHALIQLFAEKNGFVFQELIDHIDELAARIEAGTISTGELAAWLSSRLRRRDEHRPERVFAALNELASVIESLEDRGYRDHATRLNASGWMLCSQFVDALQLDDAVIEHLFDSYPALNNRWKDAVRNKD